MGFRAIGRIVLVVLFLFDSPATSTPLSSASESLPSIQVTAPRQPRRRAREASEFAPEVLLSPSRGETSLSRWLQTSPSVVPREPGSDDRTGSISIRGQEPGQSRIFLEGIPLTEAESQTAPVSLLPLEMLGAAEIYSESSPVFLGEDGLGGALHFRLLPVPLGDTGALVGWRVGSYASSRAFAQLETNVGVPTRVHASYAQSRDDFIFFQDNGTPMNPDDDRWERRGNNAVKTAVFFPEARLSPRLRLLSFNAFRESEIPGPVGIPMEGRLRQRYHVLGLRYEDEHWGDAVVYLRSRGDDLTLSVVPASVRPGVTSNLTAGGRVNGQLGPWQASLGAQWEKFSLTPNSGPGLERSRLALPVSVSLFAKQNEFEFKPALLAHLFRYEETGLGAQYFLLSPRMGFSWNVSPSFSTRAALGSYYRAPSLFELYGSASSTAPSRDLRYERAYKAELGFDARTHGIDTDFNFAYTLAGARARDLIVFIPNSQATQIAENIGESLIVTQELVTEARTLSGWGARLGGSWILSRNLSNVLYEFAKDLPLRPAFRALAEVSYRSERFSVGYNLRAQSASFWDTANLKRMPANTEQGAWATLGMGAWGTLNFEVRNLTDAIAAESTFGGVTAVDNTTGFPGYPAPGRRVYVSWQCEF